LDHRAHAAELQVSSWVEDCLLSLSGRTTDSDSLFEVRKRKIIRKLDSTRMSLKKMSLEKKSLKKCLWKK
jgi:hypothetical protein